MKEEKEQKIRDAKQERKDRKDQRTHNREQKLKSRKIGADPSLVFEMKHVQEEESEQEDPFMNKGGDNEVKFRNPLAEM